MNYGKDDTPFVLAWSIDLVDGFTLRNEKLRQASPVVPCAFNTPVPWASKGDSPDKKLLPAIGGVGTTPAAKHGPGVIKSQGLMDALVGIDANRNHTLLRVRTMGPTGLSWGEMHQAPTKSGPHHAGTAATSQHEGTQPSLASGQPPSCSS